MSTSRPTRVASLFCAVIAYFSPTTTEAATIIRDQGQIFGTGGEVHLGTDLWAQTVTTGIAGQLACLQIQPEFSVLPGTFNLAIIEGANPATGSILHSEVVVMSLSDLDALGLFNWDLTSANLFFDVDEVFAFSIRADETGFAFSANDPPGYAGGELFRNGVTLPPTEVNDIAFISYMVPEPTIVPLLMIAILTFGFSARRRRREVSAST